MSEIREISAGSVDVFNIEVEEDQSYVAEGIVVHNCDELAKSDFYGGGPGWYPKIQVPDFPHPFCRCSLYPTLRPFANAADPQPDSRRILDPAHLVIPNAATPRAAERIREQLGRLLDAAEAPLSPAERALLAHGAAVAKSWHRVALAH